MKTMKKTLLTLALSIATGTVAANATLTESLQKKFPNTKITSANYIKEFPGLVELVVDRNKIIYTNKEGSHFMIGHIFDAKNNADATQARIDSLSSYKYSELPFEDAIKVVKGNGSREFAVFTDPACPFCKKLDVELSKLTDYTMYVFPSAFKPAGKKMFSRIQCEVNPAQAWTDWMTKGVEPKSQQSCGVDKVNRTLKLASAMGVSGTPSMLAKSGKLRPGYLPAQQLDAWLNANNKQGS